MTAIEKFENLLKNVQESNLNYSVQKTPFSAIISLKCSFIKRFSDVPNSENEQFPHRQVSHCYHSDSVKKLEHENLKSENEGLKKELAAFQEAFKSLRHFDKLKHETLRLKEFYKSEQVLKT